MSPSEYQAMYEKTKSAFSTLSKRTAFGAKDNRGSCTSRR